MLRIATLLAIGLVVGFNAIDLNPGLRTKAGVNPINIGRRWWYTLPWNREDAVGEGWVLTQRPPNPPLPSLELYCPPEYHVCLLFDDTGYLAGMQMAVEKDLVKNAVYDWSIQGYTEWNVNGTIFYSMAQYFVNEEFLAQDSDTRVSSRNPDKTLQMDRIWVTSFNGELMEIPTTVKGLLDIGFHEEACIPTMGRHFLYNATENFTCAADTVFNWYPLSYDGELVGIIWGVFAQLDVPEHGRDWFERAPDLVIWAAFPDQANCRANLVRETGILATHIWFTTQPYKFTCILESDNNANN